MSVPAAACSRPRRPPPMPPGQPPLNKFVVSEQLVQVLQSSPNTCANPFRRASEGSCSVSPSSAPRRVNEPVDQSSVKLKPSRPPPPSGAPPKPHQASSLRTSPRPAPRNRSRTQITTTTPSAAPRSVPVSSTPRANRTNTSPMTASFTKSASASSIKPVISLPILKSATGLPATATTIVSTAMTTTATNTTSSPYIKAYPSSKPDSSKKYTPTRPSPSSIVSTTQTAPNKSPPPLKDSPSNSWPRSSHAKVNPAPDAQGQKSVTLNNTTPTQPPPITKILVKQTNKTLGPQTNKTLGPPRPKPPQARPQSPSQPKTQSQTTTQPPRTQPSVSQSSEEQDEEDIYTAPSRPADKGAEHGGNYVLENIDSPISEPPVYSEISDTDVADGYSVIGQIPDGKVANGYPSMMSQSATNPTYQHPQPNAKGYETPLSSKIYASLGINRELEGDYQPLVLQANRGQQNTPSDSLYYVPTTEGYMSVKHETTLPESVYQVPGSDSTNKDLYDIPVPRPIIESKKEEHEYVFMSPSSPAPIRKGPGTKGVAPSPDRVYASVL